MMRRSSHQRCQIEPRALCGTRSRVPSVWWVCLPRCWVKQRRRASQARKHQKDEPSLRLAPPSGRLVRRCRMPRQMSESAAAAAGAVDGCRKNER